MAGIYLHIPFCKKRCIYCDFYSSTHTHLKNEYVEALCKELALRHDYLQDEPIQTIYLGGGTPSQLSIAELGRLFDTIYKVYDIDSQAEITLEANPDDLSPAYVSALRQLPVNRLSMGVQTFHDEQLKFLNRRHTAAQACEAVKRCQDAGFDNLSIDLIYGLPQETEKEWQADLAQAVQLQVQHLSAYHLIYEEGTALWKLFEQHRVKEVNEDLSSTFFEMLTTTLKLAGFTHYEISNFCLPNHESRHNSSYWKGIPYLGCGASAHSFDGTSRQWNVASLKSYMEGVNSGVMHIEKEQLSATDRYNEMVMTGLRTSAGISLASIEKSFGKQLKEYCLRMAQPHLQKGTLAQCNDCIKLSHRGIFISDGIISDLIYV